MLVLAADTSTRSGSVALMEQGAPLGELRVGLGLRHTERLLPMVDALLTLCRKRLEELDLLAISLGPGSFTGLRIGVVTFRTLGQVLKRAVVGVSGLEALALSVPGAEEVVVPTVDGYKRQVYAAAFRRRGEGLERLSGDRLLAPSELSAWLVRLAEDTPLAVFGDGYERYRDELDGVHPGVVGLRGVRPSAAAVGLLGAEGHGRVGGGSATALEPRYLGKSEAELQWLKREAGRASGGEGG